MKELDSTKFLNQSIEIENLINQLNAIRKDLLNMTIDTKEYLHDYHENDLASVQNLLYYLALRSHDIRFLQVQLSKIGLSSLGRTELNVLQSIDAVLHLLYQLSNTSCTPSTLDSFITLKKDGKKLLKEHTDALLGPPPSEREVRIMVTMPSEAADDYLLVYNLLKSGMNCMRINCAHDNAEVWSQIIENLHKAEKATNLSCRIIMDLAGPKLRTGSLESKPMILKIRPKKNNSGEIVRPARIWLTKNGTTKPPSVKADFSLTVEESWLSQLSKGDEIFLKDSRNNLRSMKITDAFEEGCLAKAKKAMHITSNTVLTAICKDKNSVEFKTSVKNLPGKENSIHLEADDILVLEQNLDYGSSAILNNNGNVIIPAAIGFPFPEIFKDIKEGESIWFDDGKIGGIIDKVETDKIYVRITQTRSGGSNLKGEKGINLPDSNLHLSAMTDKDVEDLKFIADHADIVALSFANSVQDVKLLREHLNIISNEKLSIVLKIETQRGFENLPSMLLELIKLQNCGIMIARGDLAVECGFERLAEVQEEILWICEAAHVPVIWATQVLENMAKEGIPSRAEVTDAAMGEGAECVMLNKGNHIVDAVSVLDDILKRMESHKNKKRSMMRKLSLASRFREQNSVTPEI
ncbi:pyruvate kinase [Clostridium pasteurianum]|uniref:Pyruvate kinase n=1 Tax=Clostridium pasteurianum BC1 TaxID=86416 RepID=R4K7R4_CLOPA|nr:pyruvate kinase [Clostridium pasteurianum]AGK95685.1 pyruvate kinase [Clostridium pasteurianum BC1]